MDYYRILGVPRNIDRDGLHRAFREISKKAHPDRFEETRRAEAEKLYQRIVVAFNTLKDPKHRARYDKTLALGPEPPSPTTATQHKPAAPVERSGGPPQDPFQMGLALLRKGDHAAALNYLNEAVKLREDPEYYYYKAMAEIKLPGKHKDSVDSLQKAIKGNPKDPKYYETLARLYLNHGLKSRAKTVVDKALSRFPGNQDFLALAKKVHPEKTEKGGLFTGLFGKK